MQDLAIGWDESTWYATPDSNSSITRSSKCSDNPSPTFNRIIVPFSPNIDACSHLMPLSFLSCLCSWSCNVLSFSLLEVPNNASINCRNKIFLSASFLGAHPVNASKLTSTNGNVGGGGLSGICSSVSIWMKPSNSSSSSDSLANLDLEDDAILSISPWYSFSESSPSSFSSLSPDSFNNG